MKLLLTLKTNNANDEIVDLNDFLCEQNLKGFISKVIEKEPEPGTMSMGDYMPVVELILGSTVIAAGVKGLFEILKNYFEMSSRKIDATMETEKNKIEQHKIEFDLETNEGKKISIKFISFDEEERRDFFQKIDNVLKT